MAKRKTTTRKFVNSQRELAELLGITPQALSKNWIPKEGFPPKTKLGFNVLKCEEYVKREKEKKLSSVGGVNGDLERRKLELQCEKLEVQIDELKEKVIPIEEHISEISDYAQMVNSVFDQFRAKVVAITKDPKLTKDLDLLISRSRQRLRKAIDES